jgi:hypothetical protein
MIFSHHDLDFGISSLLPLHSYATSCLVNRSYAMIDSLTEDIITFADAAKTLPSRRPGKTVNKSTLWRWTEYGLRGVKLEFLYAGGQRCTSLSALQRFFDALGQPRDPVSESPTIRTDRQRRKAAIAAGKEIDRKRRAQSKTPTSKTHKLAGVS